MAIISALVGCLLDAGPVDGIPTGFETRATPEGLSQNKATAFHLSDGGNESFEGLTVAARYQRQLRLFE